MQWLINQTVQLRDGKGRHVGDMYIERIEYASLCGTFSPGLDYPSVADRFMEFEEMANQNVMSVIDEVGAAIDALNLRLETADRQRIDVHDVQIWSDGGISCRVRDSESSQINGVYSDRATEGAEMNPNGNRL